MHNKKWSTLNWLWLLKMSCNYVPLQFFYFALIEKNQKYAEQYALGIIRSKKWLKHPKKRNLRNKVAKTSFRVCFTELGKINFFIKCLSFSAYIIGLIPLGVKSICTYSLSQTRSELHFDLEMGYVNLLKDSNNWNILFVKLNILVFLNMFCYDEQLLNWFTKELHNWS